MFDAGSFSLGMFAGGIICAAVVIGVIVWRQI